MRRLSPRFLLLILAIGTCDPAAWGESQPEPLSIDIANTSIEDLLQMKVTSVSKTEERFWNAPGAVYVLTNERIRRSGAKSIPEALRLVPGVQVARIDANKWAVSVRGFNSRTSNKLLVLIDGRSVYDPLFSGVVWEAKDVMLEDVERIEVVRGPGGTLWGENAVNGVINIITKNAKDTQGALVTGGGGNEERGFGSARYGATFGDSNYARVYSKYYNRDPGQLLDGKQGEDSSQEGRGGFRFDRAFENDSSLTLLGDYYNGEQGLPVLANVRDQQTSGGSLVANWKKKFEDDSELAVLTYYDRTMFDITLLEEKRNTLALDTQYAFSPLSGHRTVAGFHYRNSSDHIKSIDTNAIVPGSALLLDPPVKTQHLVTWFLEDRMEIVEDALFFTAGSKVGYNTYTDWELQPSARLLWNVNESNVFWLAVSRAVRLPSRLESELNVVVGDLRFVSNRNADAENVVAYEAGYRTYLLESLSLDFAAFYNVYDDLVTNEGLTFKNFAHGDTYGVEAAVTYQVTPSWHLQGGYALLEMDLSLDPGSTSNPLLTTSVEESNPKSQFFIQSLYSLAPSWQLDVAVRYVDSLPALDVESYAVADVRVAYSVIDGLELAVVGQNLFDANHFEQAPATGTAVESGVYGQLQYTY